MSLQRTRDTAPEVALRRALHAQGYRFRVGVQPLPSIRRRADLVFTRRRVAVFVDGCFWHVCPEHATFPKANGAWWSEKLRKNQQRDAETTERLQQAGWIVVRIWEHVHVSEAVAMVRRALEAHE